MVREFSIPNSLPQSPEEWYEAIPTGASVGAIFKLGVGGSGC